MRTSKRPEIIDAALRVVSREGGADISFDQVAGESGLTKAGILYHFPTRDDLVLAVVDHVARACEAQMLALLEVGFDEATAAERTHAYVRMAARGTVTRADFAMYADALYRPQHLAPWDAVFERWFDVSDCPDPAERARLTAARLAADGLWVARATGGLTTEDPDYDALVDELLALTHPRERVSP